MTNPADNTPGCPTCGLAFHVWGCTREKCSLADRCMRPVSRPCEEQRAWVGHDPSGPDFEHAFIGAFEPPAPNVGTQHPLPWRWATMSDAHDWELLDADGNKLAAATNSGTLSVPDPYVRAVTERARALDVALRWALSWLDDFVDFDDHESEQRMKATAARKLLAEIDAAAKVAD